MSAGGDKPILCVEATPRVASLASLAPEALPSALAAMPPWFVPRGLAESDERYRQLIPYVLLRHRGTLLSYRRGRASSEERLRERRSVGFGGHVELTDVVAPGGRLDVWATLRRAAEREVAEELAGIGVVARRVAGAIVEDADPVSRVHLGVVEVWELAEPRARSREAAVEGVEFVPIPRLHRDGRLESWSSAALRMLAAAGPQQAAA